MAGLTRPAAACLLAFGLTLSACSADSEPSAEPSLELDENTPSPSESSTTASPAPDEIQTEFRSDGVVVTEVPPVRGVDRDVVETFIAYERGLRRSTQQAEMNALITDNTTDAIIADRRQNIDFLSTNNTRFRGVVTMEITDLQSRGQVAVVDACQDSTDLELLRDGEPIAIDGGTGRSQVRITLNRVTDQWIVTDRTDREQPC